MCCYSLWGLRRSELLGLMWSDIDLQSRNCSDPTCRYSCFIIVLLSGPQKTPTSIRMLPLTLELCKLSAADRSRQLPFLLCHRRQRNFFVLSPIGFITILNRFVRDLNKKISGSSSTHPARISPYLRNFALSEDEKIYMPFQNFLVILMSLSQVKIYVHNDVEALRDDLSAADI